MSSIRLRARASVALVVVLLVAGCASGSTPLVTATPTASPIASPTASPTASATSPAIADTQSPVPSAADVDDEAGSSAGASFAPTVMGVLPPTGGAVPTERLPGEPDAAMTPGALNPAVTQATIHSTICVSGWTATIRPSSSFTTALKIDQIVKYGYGDTRTSSYEEDHLISLELGGAPADPRNLWPEPYTATLADGRSTGARTKDGFETKLKSAVCAGAVTLASAQDQIGVHWVHAYYGIALLVLSPTQAPTAGVTPTPATPVVTPRPGTLVVRITSLPAYIAHGANGTMVAVTSPGAMCRASVQYASGTVSSAKGLQTKPVADSSGAASWTWKIGSSTKAGRSTASVSCTLGGHSASQTKTFAVT